MSETVTLKISGYELNSGVEVELSLKRIESSWDLPSWALTWNLG